MGMMLVCMERICDILLAKQIIDGEIPLLRVRADAAFQKISNPYVRSLILFLELAYGYEYTDFEGDSRTNFESHTLRNTKEGCKIKQIELIFDKTDNTIAFIDMDDEPQKNIVFTKYEGPITNDKATIFNLSMERDRQIILIMIGVLIGNKQTLPLNADLHRILDFKMYTDEAGLIQERLGDATTQISTLFANIQGSTMFLARPRVPSKLQFKQISDANLRSFIMFLEHTYGYKYINYKKTTNEHSSEISTDAEVEIHVLEKDTSRLDKANTNKLGIFFFKTRNIVTLKNIVQDSFFDIEFKEYEGIDYFEIDKKRITTFNISRQRDRRILGEMIREFIRGATIEAPGNIHNGQDFKHDYTDKVDAVQKHFMPLLDSYDLEYFFENAEGLLGYLGEYWKCTSTSYQNAYLLESKLKDKDTSKFRLQFNKDDFRGYKGNLYAASVGKFSMGDQGKQRYSTDICFVCIKDSQCYILTLDDEDIYRLNKQNRIPTSFTLDCPNTFIELASLLKKRALDIEGRAYAPNHEIAQPGANSNCFVSVYDNLENLKRISLQRQTP